ncbi:MAG: DUF2085 domain-containing protein [Candidatus Marinimicrobia bacterium]|nr:DUF2085 domain-containing protein [Candidatus Neomarinimicrobiota bacterium]
MSIISSKKKTLIIVSFAIIFGILVVSAVLEPLCRGNKMRLLYHIFHAINSTICHQYPPRCLQIFNSPMGLCSRCFAFYLAGLICTIGFPFLGRTQEQRPNFYFFILMIAPLTIDGSTQYLGLRTSTNILRLVTGGMAGIGTTITLLQLICYKFCQDHFKSMEK